MNTYEALSTLVIYIAFFALIVWLIAGFPYIAFGIGAAVLFDKWLRKDSMFKSSKKKSTTRRNAK